MSEITETTEISEIVEELTPSMQNFIIHWGEMGTRWGINRTVAQIHALLYIAPRPLNAEEISSVLAVARSTVSTGLRELQGWGLIKVVHVLGGRRDYFETINDVWELFRIVLDERKRRELDPTLRVLGEILDELDASGTEDPIVRKKVKEMYDFFETVDGLYEQVHELPMSAIVSLAKKGEALRAIIGFPASKRKNNK